MKNLILTLARRGKTILLTSHLLADVEDVCDEVLIMYGGRVLANGAIGELLADTSQLHIRLPALSEETLREVAEILQREVKEDEVEFSSPTRSLETYFLEVVRQASRQHETQGAQVGKGVAGYLREGVNEEPDVLEALSHARREVPVRVAAPEAAADEAALDSLATEPTAGEPSAAATPDDDVDQDLLDDLTK